MTRTALSPGPLLSGGFLLVLVSLCPGTAWATSITDCLTGTTQLTVCATYDSSITGNANASTIESTINAAITEIESYIYNPMTVYISFDDPTVSGAVNIGSNAGENVTDFYVMNYSTYNSALRASANSANDLTSIAQLPSSSTEPVSGITNNTQIALTCANAQALGISASAGCSPSATAPDGTVYLNLPVMNDSRSTNPTNAQYDLETVAMHEIDEVLGLSSSLNQSWAGSYITPMDLFRYGPASHGTASRLYSATSTSYFEITPATKIMQFNSTSGDDAADWASVYNAVTQTYAYTGGGVYIQDAIGTAGKTAQVNMTSASPELEALDVIGYDLSPEPSTWALALAGAGLIWLARKRAARRTV